MEAEASSHTADAKQNKGRCGAGQVAPSTAAASLFPLSLQRPHARARSPHPPLSNSPRQGFRVGTQTHGVEAPVAWQVGGRQVGGGDGACEGEKKARRGVERASKRADPLSLSLSLSLSLLARPARRVHFNSPGNQTGWPEARALTAARAPAGAAGTRVERTADIERKKSERRKTRVCGASAVNESGALFIFFRRVCRGRSHTGVCRPGAPTRTRWPTPLPPWPWRRVKTRRRRLLRPAPTPMLPNLLLQQTPPSPRAGCPHPPRAAHQPHERLARKLQPPN